jgi:Arc/MetJ-type ribon-helix-helix transcriptional regulator
MVKATYSLDVLTVKVLERVARRWGVSKSEALRRAIRASEAIAAEPETPLSALDELQAAAGLSPAAAAAWNRDARAERHSDRSGKTGQ